MVVYLVYAPLWFGHDDDVRLRTASGTDYSGAALGVKAHSSR